MASKKRSSPKKHRASPARKNGAPSAKPPPDDSNPYRDMFFDLVAQLGYGPRKVGELSTELGVSTRTIYDWRQGQTRVPKLAVLALKGLMLSRTETNIAQPPFAIAKIIVRRLQPDQLGVLIEEMPSETPTP